jgi:hypothetical protein
MGTAVLLGHLVWFAGAVALGVLASTVIALLARRQLAEPVVAQPLRAPALAETVPLAAASVLADPMEMPARASAAPVVPVHELRGVDENDSPVVADIQPRIGRS